MISRARGLWRGGFVKGLASFCFFFAGAVFASCSSVDSFDFAVAQISIEREGRELALLSAELAITQEERARGLMHRQSLDDGYGMLFIFERDQILSFWMKNTYIPLSIAFIAWDGRILEIRDMEPHNLNAVRSSRSARYALEVPQGWFSRAGIYPGDLVILPQTR
ncbi:MAG: DUF192 domain-containing protein [Spirochaetes bacterium]|nr:DUF192 domain-containing protein [Spirochaetota bacterium]